MPAGRRRGGRGGHYAWVCTHRPMSRTDPARRLLPRSATTLRAIFGNRNIASMLFVGFASGLPLALSSGTLQAWLTVRGATLG